MSDEPRPLSALPIHRHCCRLGGTPRPISALPSYSNEIARVVSWNSDCMPRGVLNKQDTFTDMLGSETEICERYAAELSALALLDRAYYLKSTATVEDRADYFRRQERLEKVRAEFYTNLSQVRRSDNPHSEGVRVRVKNQTVSQAITRAANCGMLHDLNNSLGVVIGHCELMAEFVSKDHRAAKHLSAILGAARKMATLIHGSVCEVQKRASPLSRGVHASISTKSMNDV